MKLNRAIIVGISAFGIVFAGSAVAAAAAPSAQAMQKPEARITEVDARATALALVKNGMVQSSELEREHGRLVWSFDIASPGSKNINEVLVDANTGEVLSHKLETPAEQAKEAKADKAVAK